MEIRLAIVDDHRVVRNSVREKLQTIEGIKVVMEASNGEELLEMLEEVGEEKLPEIVLIDVEMPKLDGIQTIAVGSTMFPQIKFIVFTVFDNTEKIFEAIKAGANGYLLKNDSTLNLKEAIENVALYNGVPMSPAIARKTLALLKSDARVVNPSGNKLLSSREQEVLIQLVEGLDYKEIAQKLFISAATVRTHIANIYQKFHDNSKAQAIRLAYKNNWV